MVKTYRYFFLSAIPLEKHMTIKNLLVNLNKLILNLSDFKNGQNPSDWNEIKELINDHLKKLKELEKNENLDSNIEKKIFLENLTSLVEENKKNSCKDILEKIKKQIKNAGKEKISLIQTSSNPMQTNIIKTKKENTKNPPLNSEEKNILVSNIICYIEELERFNKENSNKNNQEEINSCLFKISWECARLSWETKKLYKNIICEMDWIYLEKIAIFLKDKNNNFKNYLPLFISDIISLKPAFNKIKNENGVKNSKDTETKMSNLTVFMGYHNDLSYLKIINDKLCRFLLNLSNENNNSDLNNISTLATSRIIQIIGEYSKKITNIKLPVWFLVIHKIRDLLIHSAFSKRLRGILAKENFKKFINDFQTIKKFLENLIKEYEKQTFNINKENKLEVQSKLDHEKIETSLTALNELYKNSSLTALNELYTNLKSKKLSTLQNFKSNDNKIEKNENPTIFTLSEEQEIEVRKIFLMGKQTEIYGKKFDLQMLSEENWKKLLNKEKGTIYIIDVVSKNLLINDNREPINNKNVTGKKDREKWLRTEIKNILSNKNKDKTNLKEKNERLPPVKNRAPNDKTKENNSSAKKQQKNTNKKSIDYKKILTLLLTDIRNMLEITKEKIKLYERNLDKYNTLLELFSEESLFALAAQCLLVNLGEIITGEDLKNKNIIDNTEFIETDKYLLKLFRNTLAHRPEEVDKYYCAWFFLKFITKFYPDLDFKLKNLSELSPIGSNDDQQTKLKSNLSCDEIIEKSEKIILLTNQLGFHSKQLKILGYHTGCNYGPQLAINLLIEFNKDNECDYFAILELKHKLTRELQATVGICTARKEVKKSLPSDLQECYLGKTLTEAYLQELLSASLYFIDFIRLESFKKKYNDYNENYSNTPYTVFFIQNYNVLCWRDNLKYFNLSKALECLIEDKEILKNIFSRKKFIETKLESTINNYLQQKSEKIVTSLPELKKNFLGKNKFEKKEKHFIEKIKTMISKKNNKKKQSNTLDIGHLCELYRQPYEHIFQYKNNKIMPSSINENDKIIGIIEYTNENIGKNNLDLILPDMSLEGMKQIGIAISKLHLENFNLYCFPDIYFEPQKNELQFEILANWWKLLAKFKDFNDKDFYSLLADYIDYKNSLFDLRVLQKQIAFLKKDNKKSKELLKNQNQDNTSKELLSGAIEKNREQIRRLHFICVDKVNEIMKCEYLNKLLVELQTVSYPMTWGALKALESEESICNLYNHSPYKIYNKWLFKNFEIYIKFNYLHKNRKLAAKCLLTAEERHNLCLVYKPLSELENLEYDTYYLSNTEKQKNSQEIIISYKFSEAEKNLEQIIVSNKKLYEYYIRQIEKKNENNITFIPQNLREKIDQKIFTSIRHYAQENLKYIEISLKQAVNSRNNELGSPIFYYLSKGKKQEEIPGCTRKIINKNGKQRELLIPNGSIDSKYLMQILHSSRLFGHDGTVSSGVSGKFHRWHNCWHKLSSALIRKIINSKKKYEKKIFNNMTRKNSDNLLKSLEEDAEELLVNEEFNKKLYTQFLDSIDLIIRKIKFANKILDFVKQEQCKKSPVISIKTSSNKLGNKSNCNSSTILNDNSFSQKKNNSFFLSPTNANNPSNSNNTITPEIKNTSTSVPYSKSNLLFEEKKGGEHRKENSLEKNYNPDAINKRNKIEN